MTYRDPVGIGGPVGMGCYELDLEPPEPEQPKDKFRLCEVCERPFWIPHYIRQVDICSEQCIEERRQRQRAGTW